MKLNKLERVCLENNDCINSNLRGGDELAMSTQFITEQCGFCSRNTSTEKRICELSNQVQEISAKNFVSLMHGQNDQIKLMKIFTSKTVVDNENCRLESAKKTRTITSSTIEIETLKLKLRATENKNQEQEEIIKNLKYKIETMTRKFN